MTLRRGSCQGGCLRIDQWEWLSSRAPAPWTVSAAGAATRHNASSAKVGSRSLISVDKLDSELPPFEGLTRIPWDVVGEYLKYVRPRFSPPHDGGKRIRAVTPSMKSRTCGDLVYQVPDDWRVGPVTPSTKSRICGGLVYAVLDGWRVDLRRPIIRDFLKNVWRVPAAAWTAKGEQWWRLGPPGSQTD
ncbi:hypothetical protein K438DRAFT_1762378 [Mycena galopus ATCC 62051]|nr:hypothetical protein K438DRAFT_1762378 [Mycena galopus ATCC 62051]